MPEGNAEGQVIRQATKDHRGNVNIPTKPRFQAIPLGQPRESRLKWFSKRVLVPLGITAATAIGLNTAVQTVTSPDQNRPAEAEAYHQNPWADKTRKKLDGELPYDEGEVLQEQMAVVNGGEILAGDSVNVRDGFPAPYNGRGEPVTVLGTIKLGTQIHNVLIVDGVIGQRESKWGAFKLGDTPVVGKDGKPIHENPDRIVTIYGKYLDPVDLKTPQQ